MSSDNPVKHKELVGRFRFKKLTVVSELSVLEIACTVKITIKVCFIVPSPKVTGKKHRHLKHLSKNTDLIFFF